jgi:hypothetical protein
MALGSCVLHGLGVHDEFTARGLKSRRYELANHSGEVLRGMDLSVLAGSTGPIIMPSRTYLLDLLCKACGNLRIRFGASHRAPFLRSALLDE